MSYVKHEYKVLFAFSNDEIERIISSYLNEGYTCQGGISVVLFGSGTVYYQAVIRSEILNG